MGLAVVHGIIERHHGVIWVDSKPGKGSTFQVFLPSVEAVASPQAVPLPAVLKGNERILVVDDEKTLLDTEVAMLERLGYAVIGTTSPVEALEIFRLEPDRFDLVYTDMTMPGMTGLTLAKKIMRIRPHVPVILYSGYGTLVDNHEIVKSGVSAFLTKPMILEDLAATVREALKNGRK